jgi:hypothetical protein
VTCTTGAEAAAAGARGATDAGRLSPGTGLVLVMRRGSSSSCTAGSAAGALTADAGAAGAGSATRSASGSGCGAATGSATTTGAGAATTGSGFCSTSTAAGAAFFAAAFLTGARVSVSDGAAAAGAAALPAAAFFAALFLTGLTSSGCSARVRPSRMARRSSRSACASMRVLEWVFTPTPMVSHSAIISAFVIPSFLASSCTRMFFAKTSSAFRWHRRAGVCSDSR